MGKTAVATKTSAATKKVAKRAPKKVPKLDLVIRLSLSSKRKWGTTMSAIAVRDAMAGSFISKTQILNAINLKPTEWSQLSTKRKKLDVLRSDRLKLVDQLVDRSIEVYGDKGKAERWMKRTNPYLGNKAPVELLGSIEGIAKAMAELDRIEAGVFA